MHTTLRHEFLHDITDTRSYNFGLLQWNEEFDIASPDQAWIIFCWIGRARDSAQAVINAVAPLCI